MSYIACIALTTLGGGCLGLVLGSNAGMPIPGLYLGATFGFAMHPLPTFFVLHKTIMCSALVYGGACVLGFAVAVLLQISIGPESAIVFVLSLPYLAGTLVISACPRRSYRLPCCAECMYRLDGIDSHICPECGTDNADWLKRDRHEVLRWERRMRWVETAALAQMVIAIMVLIAACVLRALR